MTLLKESLQTNSSKVRLLLGPHLCTFSGCGADGPAQDLLDDIRQQADGDEQDDAEPSRTAGQHLHEDVVHPLVVEEGPEEERGGEKKKRRKQTLLTMKQTQKLTD